MCLYVVTRFLICVYLDVFNKMFYFKLCKCRYRGKPILYIPGFKNSTLLPYCIPEKKEFQPARRQWKYIHIVKDFKFSKGSLQKRQTDEYIHTKLQNTRPLTTMVLQDKLCCWKLYKHMISYDFLYLFLNPRTYMFQLEAHLLPLSISFFPCLAVPSEIGPQVKGQFSFPTMEVIASKKHPFRNNPHVEKAPSCSHCVLKLVLTIFC